MHCVVTVPETHNTFEITDFTESGKGSKILTLTLANVCLFRLFFSLFACLFVCFALFVCFFFLVFTNLQNIYMKKVFPCETPTEALTRQLVC